MLVRSADSNKDLLQTFRIRNEFRLPTPMKRRRVPLALSNTIFSGTTTKAMDEPRVSPMSGLRSLKK